LIPPALEDDVRRLWFLLGAAAIVALAIAAPILLAPAGERFSFPKLPVIDPAEHARTIVAMRPPKRARPVIAILAQNAATEVTDLMIPYDVLTRAGVADVFIVAERAAPIPLYPFSKLGRGPLLFSVDPQLSAVAFDTRWPEGADYVVVPAMQPRDDPFVVGWLNAQRGKGATIVSVCAGAVTLGAAGLLDGHRATTHWAYIEQLRRDHPTMQWVPDRRYVADRGIVTATGISASMPLSIAMVEAIAGNAKAQAVAAELGVDHWDERHRTGAFQLTTERKKTFVRNMLSVWRHRKLGVEIERDVDEIALALMTDVYSRTSLSTVVTMGDPVVRSQHGLSIRPAAPAAERGGLEMLAAPSSSAQVFSLERGLSEISARFDRPTADISALAMEYPWAP
jgi:transcriptional regulator GlxA family with amidase domain